MNPTLTAAALAISLHGGSIDTGKVSNELLDVGIRFQMGIASLLQQTNPEGAQKLRELAYNSEDIRFIEGEKDILENVVRINKFFGDNVDKDLANTMEWLNGEHKMLSERREEIWNRDTSGITGKIEEKRMDYPATGSWGIQRKPNPLLAPDPNWDTPENQENLCLVPVNLEALMEAIKNRGEELLPEINEETTNQNSCDAEPNIFDTLGKRFGGKTKTYSK